MIIDFYNKVIT